MLWNDAVATCSLCESCAYRSRHTSCLLTNAFRETHLSHLRRNISSVVYSILHCIFDTSAVISRREYASKHEGDFSQSAKSASQRDNFRRFEKVQFNWFANPINCHELSFHSYHRNRISSTVHMKYIPNGKTRFCTQIEINFNCCAKNQKKKLPKMCDSHEFGIFGSRHSCFANPKILRWAINYLVAVEITAPIVVR